MDIYDVIKTVHLSEKATLGSDTANSYVFKVDRKSNKFEIKQAVETLLGKKVIKVTTANYSGKLKRQRRADAGRTNHWKKAVVRLAEGEKLDFV